MDLKVDDNGDLVVENDDLVLLTGLDAIIQHLKIRFRLFLGEWFLDTRVGIPWFEDILRKSPDLNVVNSLLREVITTTPGVIAITAFDLAVDSATRVLSMRFSASTTEGPITDFSLPFIIPQIAA